RSDAPRHSPAGRAHPPARGRGRTRHAANTSRPGRSRFGYGRRAGVRPAVERRRARSRIPASRNRCRRSKQGWFSWRSGLLGLGKTAPRALIGAFILDKTPPVALFSLGCLRARRTLRAPTLYFCTFYLSAPAA